MEEYASRGRICDWFRPPKAPIIALIVPSIKTIELGYIIQIIDKGATFCQVEIRMHKGHDKEHIT